MFPWKHECQHCGDTKPALLLEFRGVILCDVCFERIERERCVRCGYCCTVRPCDHGDWDEKRGCCSLLTDPDEQGMRRCMIYRTIAMREKDSKYPMMGSGCSSSMFNDVREARIARMKESV